MVGQGELKKILYVEDEKDIQKIARVALEDVGGFVVEILGSGGEALNIVASFEPDLILLDVMMPDMDGPAILKKLQASDTTRSIPVVFMTAKTQTAEIARFIELGAVDVIKKPFNPLLLPDLLRSIWQAQRKKAS